MISMSEVVKTFTAGIVNIPLTKPAKVFFIEPELIKQSQILSVLESLGGYEVSYRTNKDHITVMHAITTSEIEPAKLKMIWNNFKTLKPKFQSNYRYFFYEIDTKDQAILDAVVKVYCDAGLPVYVHETLHGFHFLSVKPITKEQFKLAVSVVRHFNPKYPPITLRVIPNKHPNEPDIFKRGFIVSEKYHYDTRRLEHLIQTQNIDELSQKYIVVNYAL